MLVAFQDDHFVVKLKHTVGALSATESLFNHNVRGIPTEFVLVQIGHQSVLLRETISLKPSGVAEFAFVGCIQDHEKSTRHTGSLHEILICPLAMGFAMIRNEVLSVDGGFAAHDTLRARAKEHPRQTMACAARGFTSRESIFCDNATFVALRIHNVHHPRVFVPCTEPPFPTRDIIIPRPTCTPRMLTGSCVHYAYHFKRGMSLADLWAFSWTRIGCEDVTSFVVTYFRN